MHRSRARRRLRPAATVLTTLSMVGALTLVQTPPASAAGLIPSGTTVTVAPSTSSFGSTVHITASVKILGLLPGIGITPKGSVTFTVTSPSHVDLGSRQLGSCLLTVCTASIDTDQLPAGNIVLVKATYSGDTLLAASSGTGKAKVLFTTSDTETCTPDSCSAYVQTPDGSTSGNLTLDGTGDHTLSLSLDTGPDVACSTTETPSGAAEITFDVSPEDVGKMLSYQITGPEAQIVANHAAAHPHYLVCFQSTVPFFGYTNGVPGSAPLIGGYYTAFLPACADTDGGRPCFDFSNNLDNEFPNVVADIYTNVGDPKAHL